MRQFIISDIGEDFPDSLIMETSGMVENNTNIHGKYLFFVTSHSNHFPSTHTHFYWVDTKIIEDLKPKELN